MIDVNDALPQRGGDLIPAGTKAKVVGIIRPGGVNRPGEEASDGGYPTASKQAGSDVLYLSWEFTVLEGPHARRKFWQNMSVAGGEVNDKGESKSWNITKSTLRAMINSAWGFKSDDISERALTARRFNSWSDLDGIEFVCTIKIQQPKTDSPYAAQNAIATVIEPEHKDYAALMAGLPAAGPAAGPGAGAGSGSGAPVPVQAPAWASAPKAAAVAKAATVPAGGNSGAGGGNMPAWAR